jgi:hypothetical protein
MDHQITKGATAVIYPSVPKDPDIHAWGSQARSFLKERMQKQKPAWCIPLPVLSGGNDALMVRWWDCTRWAYSQGLKISFRSSNEIPIVFQAIFSVFDAYICYPIYGAYAPRNL